MPIFRKDLILVHVQQLARKKHVEKEGKATCKIKIHMQGGKQA